MHVAIIGGGIAGLALALNLHARKIGCTVYESVPEIREIGVGITLLPHGVRELFALGLRDALTAAALETTQSAFFNRFGQKIYAEARGRYAGYEYPELSIHRGRLHRILYDETVARLGAAHVLTGRRFVGMEQDEQAVTLHFTGTAGERLPPVHADVAIGCDGVNSVLRRQFYPDETMATSGINMWRGVTRHKPILDGRTYMRVGSINTGKMVIYPIIDDIDGEGNQLINWVAEMNAPTDEQNNWNKPGRLEDFLPVFAGWRFDWLDVGALIRNADTILEYPMADKDPIPQWSFGRVTLAGDAAHPMYPRGSTGSAQAMVDARTLADCLLQPGSPQDALLAYEAARRETTAVIVRTNRSNPPDFINIRVEQLTGDKPFERLDDYITQDELRALSDGYKQVAGYALKDLAARPA